MEIIFFYLHELRGRNMFGNLWFLSDNNRLGFAMKFENGYKVVVEYLRSEKCKSGTPVASKKEYIKGISWEAIGLFMDESKCAEGEDVGNLFDVMVYNSKGKRIRLPRWSKRVEFLSGVDLSEVVDTLHFVKRIKQRS